MKIQYLLTSILFLLCISCSTAEITEQATGETKPSTPEAKKYLKAQKIIKEGNPFPAFSLPNEQDSIITDQAFVDGYTFYMFWGTWCASCIDNIVAVRDMKKQGLLQNINFVSVSVDKDHDRWKQFIYQYDMADYMDNILLGRDRENI